MYGWFIDIEPETFVIEYAHDAGAYKIRHVCFDDSSATGIPCSIFTQIPSTLYSFSEATTSEAITTPITKAPILYMHSFIDIALQFIANNICLAFNREADPMSH